MNRELKFRLHDKEGNVIGYEVHIQNEFGCYQIYQTSLRGDFEEQKNVREGYFIAANYKCQFTGLLDSHRNEIYENDILTFPISVDSKEDYFYCKFTNGAFNFFTKNGLIKNVDTTIYTVVGNIIKHSDLLK